jgi:cytosine/adenosine deaminase-related metal-dependent hydrolase
MKIYTADFILPISSKPLQDAAIVIENDKIIAVGNRLEILESFVNAESEHFSNSVIMPSFVNSHSHLELTAFRGFLDDVENDFFTWLIKLTTSRDKLSNEDIIKSAIFGALEGLRSGVTTFADIGRFGFAGLNALKMLGLRGTVFQETNFSPDNSTANDDLSILIDKYSSLKNDETNLVKVGISPHSPYTVSPSLFEKIAEFSLQNTINISIHAAESDMESDLLRFGKGQFANVFEKQNLVWKSPQVSSIQYLYDLGMLETKPLLAHCVSVNDKDIDLIKLTDSKIAHCPKSNAKFGHGIASYQKFIDKKIKTGLGSDSVASNNTCDILEEARFANLLSRTKSDKTRLITAEETLKSATLGGAECLGLESQIGTLEVGKQADFIVVKLDNVAQLPIFDIYSAILFATSARDIFLTVCAGKELFRDGKALLINELELKNDLLEIAKKL